MNILKEMLFLCLGVCLHLAIGIEDSWSYDQPMFINSEELSIVSTIYNPSSHYSLWVNRIFGNEAIFYNHSISSKTPSAVTTEEKLQRTKLFQEYFRLPSEFLLPTCSLELFGYITVKEIDPFSFNYTYQKPSIGKAEIVFSKLEKDTKEPNKTLPLEQDTWNCVYRAMYDNTAILSKLKLRPNHFWPIFLYCPAPKHENSCANLINLYRQNFQERMRRELTEKYFPGTEYRSEPQSQELDPNLIQGFSNNQRILLSKRLSAKRKANDPYGSFLRSINSITMLAVMGLRSSYAISSYGISPKFIFIFYKTLLSLDEVLPPQRPQLNQPHPHVVFPEARKAPRKKKENSRSRYLPTIFISAKVILHFSNETRHRPWELPIEIDLVNSARKPRSEDLGVCATIPYVSSDDSKAIVNGAMIYEYLRYYTKLGYKVMLFDRNGRHFDAIFNAPYAKRFLSSSRHPLSEYPHFHYYNFTTLQLLKGYPIDIRYENDIGLSPAVFYTDYDKRYTYTYCRFAFKHLYGMENIVINDFDEFLYCPRGGSNAQSQREYQQSYFRHLRSEGYEQLLVKQRVLVSRQDNMKTCLEQQIAQASIDTSTLPSELAIVVSERIRNASIFHCLATFSYSVKVFFEKSIHFGHYCPYTHYHYSSYLRYFDCYANTYLTATRRRRDFDHWGCSMIHLTTRPLTYNRSHSFRYHDIQSGINELFLIANS